MEKEEKTVKAQEKKKRLKAGGGQAGQSKVE